MFSSISIFYPSIGFRCVEVLLNFFEDIEIMLVVISILRWFLYYFWFSAISFRYYQYKFCRLPGRVSFTIYPFDFKFWYSTVCRKIYFHRMFFFTNFENLLKNYSKLVVKFDQMFRISIHSLTLVRSPFTAGQDDQVHMHHILPRQIRTRQSVISISLFFSKKKMSWKIINFFPRIDGSILKENEGQEWKSEKKHLQTPGNTFLMRYYLCM